MSHICIFVRRGWPQSIVRAAALAIEWWCCLMHPPGHQGREGELNNSWFPWNDHKMKDFVSREDGCFTCIRETRKQRQKKMQDEIQTFTAVTHLFITFSLDNYTLPQSQFQGLMREDTTPLPPPIISGSTQNCLIFLSVSVLTYPHVLPHFWPTMKQAQSQPLPPVPTHLQIHS